KRSSGAVNQRAPGDVETAIRRAGARGDVHRKAAICLAEDDLHVAGVEMDGAELGAGGQRGHAEGKKRGGAGEFYLEVARHDVPLLFGGSVCGRSWQGGGRRTPPGRR